MPEDIDTLLATAKLPERTSIQCLRGDLQAEFERLERQLAQVRDSRTDSLADGDEAHQIAEQIEELRAEMAESSVEFRLRALHRRRYTKLRAEHPVREGDEQDARTGFNTETFFDALLRECIVEPAMTDERFERLLAVLTHAQYDELAGTALELNVRGVSVPFSFAASRMTQHSDAESKRPNDSASASNGSTGGNRATRRAARKTKPAG